MTTERQIHIRSLSVHLLAALLSREPQGNISDARSKELMKASLEKATKLYEKSARIQ